MFGWRASTNVSAVDVYWPVPERLNLLGFETYGYSSDVLLPMSVAVADPGKPVELRLRANYAICSGEICTYHDELFAVRLPAGAAKRSAHARLIEAFSERVPKTGDAGLRIVGVIAMGSGKNCIMEVMAASEAGLSSPDVIVEGPADFFFGTPKTELSDGGRTAQLVLPVAFYGGGVPLAGVAVALTLVDGARAVEAKIVIGSPRE